MFSKLIHERDTVGTSDAGVPGIVPAVCLLERVLRWQRPVCRGNECRRK